MIPRFPSLCAAAFVACVALALPHAAQAHDALFTAKITSLEEALNSAVSRVVDLEARADSLESKYQGAGVALDAVFANLDDLKARVDGNASRVGNQSSAIDDLYNLVDELRGVSSGADRDTPETSPPPDE